MRVAMRHIVDNLVWSVSGTVWAIWRLEPVGGRYVSVREREEVLARTTSLVRSLTGTPRVFSLCAQIDPGEVVARQVDGVNLAGCPRWAQTAHAQLDMFTGVEMHQRTMWLAVPLASPGRRADVSAALHSTWAELSTLLGMPPAPVRGSEVAAYRKRAQQLAAGLGSLPLRAATPAEIVWMHQHAVHRGLEEPLLLRAERSVQRGSRLAGGQLVSTSYADLGTVRLAEGGQAAAGAGEVDEGADRDEVPPGGQGGRGLWWRRKAPSPLMRRWLQVECEAGTGYQAQLVLAEIPAAVPATAADVLAQLEALPFAVDVVIDMQLVPADTAQAQVRRKKRELVDQAEQYGAHTTGLPESLHDAAGELGELGARLSRSSVEVEVQSTTVLTVWGPTERICEERARTLAAWLSGMDYRAVRPVGAQEQLFTLGLPGTAPPLSVREWRQHQLSEDWAMSGAFTTTTVGDPTGAMLGISLDAGTVRPVLVNLANAPKQHASASMGVIGELGAGKSVVQKMLTAAVVDRGGRAIVIDRTPIREWARFASTAAAGDCQVIDAARAELSIDPLRVFDPVVGAHYALSYLTLQLGVGPMSAAGAVLNRAVKLVAAGPRPSMAAVLAELATMADGSGTTRADEAATMGDLLRIVADNPLAAMVFDDALPPVSLEGDLSSDFVVVTTAGLTLPPREAFGNPEMLRHQPLEALIGRAVLYLIAAIARQVAFQNPERFCAIALDECYWLTSSAEGLALVHEVVHDGRKHGAGVILGSHDAEELGDTTVRALLAYKALLRTTDPTLAARGLEFLGLPTDDEDLIRLVTTGLSPVGKADRLGEMLLRDPRTQIGRVKALVPPVARIQEGIFTTPGETAAAPAAGGAGTPDADGQEGPGPVELDKTAGTPRTSTSRARARG